MKNRVLRPDIRFLFIFAIAILFVGFQTDRSFGYEKAGTIYEEVEVGQSKEIKTDITINKVILPEKKEDIIDVKVLGPDRITVTGKRKGTTTLELRSTAIENRKEVTKATRVYLIEVQETATAKVKARIYDLLKEKNLAVYSAGDNIILSGTVSSPANMAQAVAITEGYLSAKGRIINLAEVSGVQQVMLEVRVSEISRSLLKRLGFNFQVISKTGQTFGISLLNALTTPQQLTLGPTGLTDFKFGMSQNLSAIFGIGSNPTVTSFIDALKEDGLLKVLAEPTLITTSGQKANFLAGGEFPVPVPQNNSGQNSTITIEWKKFGVMLDFTPTVMSDKHISMLVAPEVSDLDFSNGVNLQGFTVPSIQTRRMATTVELADGQSFAIGGLLKDETRSQVDKFPVLGEIPVLGSLFRSSRYRTDETELVIIVTPHLVRPLDMTKQSLPTDAYVDPNDFEFYLLGSLEGRPKRSMPKTAMPEQTTAQGGMEGEVGHIMPK